MPYVPYRSRPVASKIPIESSKAPLSTPTVPPDLPSVPEEGPDAFLDDFPVPVSPKKPTKAGRAPIEPGKPRRRESRAGSGLSRVSMAAFNPTPAAVERILFPPE